MDCKYELNKKHALQRDNECSFLNRECAHAHERVIAIVDFSLGRSVALLVGWFGC